MEVALFIVALALGIGAVPAALWVAADALERRRARELVAFWGQAAGEAGLSGVEPSGDFLTASSGSLLVRLSRYQEGEERGTRVAVTSPSLAPGLTLHAEGPHTLPPGPRHPKEIEVGDEDFDQQVSVQGPPALALALLDADMRRTVRAMLRGRLEVRGHRPLWASGSLDEGVLRVDVPERVRGPRIDLAERVRRLPWTRPERYPLQAGDAFLDGEHRLPAVVRAALDLGARLTAPGDLPARIAANLSGEQEAGVRLKALLTLLREFPEHVATRVALREALEDPDAEVRVCAGMALGADGRDVLLDVAGGEGAEDATSARAVAALFRSLTLAEAASVLKTALRTRRLATAKECLTVLGRRGRDAIPTLAKVLLVERGELGEAAAEALGATGDASAEAPLLRALAEGPLVLCQAAAWALGQVGTREAVAPLHEAEAADTELRGPARQAIAQIHARLSGAAQGQLSLAVGESGRLSIADDETGHLSLSDAGDAALSRRPR